jgi:Uma2 family endonuclease
MPATATRQPEPRSAAPASESVPPLCAGDRLGRDEFLRRWDAMPGLKFAELLQGVVYMPSPVGREHGRTENLVGGVFYVYAARTPGTDAANNATLLLLEDESSQADVHLRILHEYGGQTRDEGVLIGGAPEFCAEVCVTSAAYDLHQKKDVYAAAGVREYLAVLMWEREVRLHRLTPAGYELVPVPADGVLRSQAFPGLWISAPALLSGDRAAALEALETGLRSEEHAAFVRDLAARRR